jgi:DNA repair exonuclease SbcCD ATPase subunit
MEEIEELKKFIEYQKEELERTERENDNLQKYREENKKLKKENKKLKKEDKLNKKVIKILYHKCYPDGQYLKRKLGSELTNNGICPWEPFENVVAWEGCVA